jgi:hypothetical protein
MDYCSYLSDTRILQVDNPHQAEHPENHQSELDASFDAFLCECGIPLTDGKQYHDVNQESTPSNQSYSQSSQSSSVFHSPQSSLSPPLNDRQKSSSTLSPELKCQWANCNSQFTSLYDLVGHVNYHHLRLPVSTSGPSEVQQNSLSCLWGNCDVYPSTEATPGPSGENQIDDALGVLASHLMHDHLGLLSPISGSPSAFSLAEAPATSDLSPNLATLLAPPSDPAHDVCIGTHTCHWKLCSASFSSCDDLTAHISSVHIGGGRSRYDCFWKGCERNGEKGFSSKQKICRHLQVRNFCPTPIVY